MVVKHLIFAPVSIFSVVYIYLFQSRYTCADIARGDVALSVLMTTVTTIAGIFTTPLLCKTILGAVVPVDAVGIAISCLQVILAPIVSTGSCILTRMHIYIRTVNAPQIPCSSAGSYSVIHFSGPWYGNE